MIAAVGAALASNVLPYGAMIADRASSADSRSSFWRPVVDYLRAHSSPGYRVEVVPTANHWEAYYLHGRALRWRAAGTASSTSQTTPSCTRRG